MGIYSIQTAEDELATDIAARHPPLVIDENTGRCRRSPRPRVRIISTPTGQELIAEPNSFEVDFTSAGNMRVDVRSKDTTAV